MALIALSADLHLGVNGWGKINPSTGMNQQVERFLEDFNWLCDNIIAAKVDVFVIVGDIFHTRTPSNSVREAFAASIKKVLDAGIEVLIVLGNHDIQIALGAQDSLAELRAIAPKGLQIIKDPQIVTFNGNSSPVQFICLPWRKHAGEVVLAASTLKEQLDPKIPAFILGHFTVAGAVTGAEVLYQLGTEEAVPLEAVMDSRVEHAFLGHIHKKQSLNQDVEYLGSMDRVDFSERHEKKWCLLVKVKGKGDFKTNYIDMNPQRYVQLEFDMTAGQKVALKPGEDVKGAVVKVEIICSEDQRKQFDHMAFMKMMEDALFVVEPSFKIVHEDEDRRETGISKGMGLEESLNLWLDNQKVDKVMREKVLAKAKEIFEEVAR